MPSSSVVIKNSPWAVFLIFLRLGLTSFGGPIAHLGYFRHEFVTQRGWLSERHYADLVALCQFLPGPASSQVGMALGLLRAGYAGACAAWLGFTLPSAIALILLALGLNHYGETLPSGLLHGLKVVAVAVVAQAIWGMARTLCQGVLRVSMMVLTTCWVLWMPSAWAQLLALGVAALMGLRYLHTPLPDDTTPPLPMPLTRRAGVFWLVLFFLFLVSLPLLARAFPQSVWPVIEVFYRAGALVFGGGHVVLPLLYADIVPSGWLNHDTFLAGYGAAQAVPGPLFTFVAYVGASMGAPLSGWSGGALCLVAIFTPSFLLMAGAMPFWAQWRANPRAQAALAGVNAAVVGLLVAAFYQPVWTSAIHAPADFAGALLALTALMVWKFPPWVVVLLGGFIGSFCGVAL